MKWFSWGKHHGRKTPAPGALFLFNTLTGKKERFTPLSSQVVKMYNCGPTVYQPQHIGNLRSYVFADVLKRALLYDGFAVRQVINITDVGHLTSDEDSGEDKVEEGAKRAGTSVKKLTASITRTFMEDLEKLNIKTDSITFTKATDFIDEQIALVKTLEEKGYTYRINDGIYFDTSRFPEYGKLGNIHIEGQKEGARVEVNPEKRHPADFALWKFSPAKSTREQEWDSPWGTGFPGWHAECTAMIFSKLGRQIDIHTGGIDHIPVHHNNEIAQAEAITKKPYVSYWLHNAFLTLDGQKISKSLGNTVLLRQIEDRGIAPLAYRYWLLTAHYRTQVNFTWEAIAGAETAFSRLLRMFVEELGSKNGAIVQTYAKRFRERINDDLDTPGALALLWELIRDEQVQDEDKRVTLLDFDKVLGLGLIEGHRRLKAMLAGMEKRVEVSDIPEEIQGLIYEREKARAEKRWEDADKFRKQIEERGYTVTDTASGPEIIKK